MLRDNFYAIGKPVRANYKADVAMKTGMGVVLNDEDKTADFPAAAASTEIYLVDKERISTVEGQEYLSDYATEFNDVAAGEFVKLKKYAAGEEFLTDQKGTTATAGKVLAVGVDGKWANAATTLASAYMYVEDVTDNGHTLMKIRVLDTAIKNS